MLASVNSTTNANPPASPTISATTAAIKSNLNVASRCAQLTAFTTDDSSPSRSAYSACSPSGPFSLASIAFQVRVEDSPSEADESMPRAANFWSYSRSLMYTSDPMRLRTTAATFILARLLPPLLTVTVSPVCTPNELAADCATITPLSSSVTVPPPDAPKKLGSPNHPSSPASSKVTISFNLFSELLGTAINWMVSLS